MFWAGPNFLSQPKNLFAYCASHKHFVPDKEMICIFFCACTKVFEEALMPSPSASSKFVLSVLKFLGILKFLSYTQNILGVLK